MQNYRVTFKGAFKAKQIAPFRCEKTKIGDVIAEVPVYGCFLRFRGEEIRNTLIVETWRKVMEEYDAYGYEDVFVEKI